MEHQPIESTRAPPPPNPHPSTPPPPQSCTCDIEQTLLLEIDVLRNIKVKCGTCREVVHASHGMQ